MEKDYLIKITLALYRVTEFFPEKEPLKFFLREKSNQILGNAILFFSKKNLNLDKHQRKFYSERVLKDIDLLQAYFEIAEKQNWVKKENFWVLKGDYDKLKEEIKENLKNSAFKMVEAEFETVKSKKIINFDAPDNEEAKILTKNLIEDKNGAGANGEVLNIFKKERHTKILKILQEKKQIQVKDLKETFPQLTKRTLRRDFDYLLKMGAIERIGQTNRTLYQLK